MYPRAWFGLGDEEIVGVTVLWPDGVEQAVAVPSEDEWRLTVEKE